MKSKTLWTAHMDIYLGFEGLLLKTPFINSDTFGCIPTFESLIGLWKIDIADLWYPIALNSYLAWKSSPRKSNTGFMSQ